jgi:hypothetical protein
MPFPPRVKEQAMAACGRRCCICNKFASTNMECHHIVQEADGGSDKVENCIPLCFDCHADVANYNVRHPRGTKFSAGELRAHRDRTFRYIEDFPTPAAATQSAPTEPQAESGPARRSKTTNKRLAQPGSPGAKEISALVPKVRLWGRTLRGQLCCEAWVAGGRRLC